MNILDSSLPYDIDKIGISVVHFGPGAFHRAHQAVYTHNLISKTNGDYGICGVSLRSAGVRDALADQKGVYTLAILDREISFQPISSIRELLVAPENPAKVIERLATPSTKTVTLTITEKGYCLNAAGKLDENNPDIAHDLGNLDNPKSAIGYIVAGLQKRKYNGIQGLTIISCDNQPDNGEKLGAAVIDFASKVDTNFANWIKENCVFPSTMVDSITPSTDDALRQQVKAATDIDDAWPIQRESFTQWVIEDLKGANMPPWHEVGATLTKDVASYEKTKLRILNGLHSSSAFIGQLLGLETVHQAVTDTRLRPFLENLCKQEIIESLADVDALDVEAYAVSIFERFENPNIVHKLSQIAWDSSQKLPIRILGTLLSNLEEERSTDMLAFVVAAWMEMVCKYQREDLNLTDPMSETLLECAKADDTTKAFLALDSIFPASITKNDALVQAISAYANALKKNPEDALKSST